MFAGHQKIDEVFSTNQKNMYTAEAKLERHNLFNIGILPPPGMIIQISDYRAKDLIEAGKALDRAEFTVSGRRLMKHGYREGSVFPKPTGTPEQINRYGQTILEEILQDPNKKVYELSDGSLKVYSSNGRGVFFKKDGKFRGFIEEQYE